MSTALAISEPQTRTPNAEVRGSHDQAAAALVELHVAAAAADRATGEAARAHRLTRELVEASLAAHDDLAAACESFRSAHHPRAGRVVARWGEVFTVSPGGRRVRRVYLAPRVYAEARAALGDSDGGASE